MAKKKWLIGLGLSSILGFLSLVVAASVAARHLEPYIREQAIRYLRWRFDSEVELASLRVRRPNVSRLRLLLTGGRGTLAHVEGEGLLLRHKGRRDLPPVLAMKKFSFDVDLRTLFGPQKVVPLVTLDGVEITIPPKGERPQLSIGLALKGDSPQRKASTQSAVVIEEVIVKEAVLVILPKDKTKVPLRFDIYWLRLESAGFGVAMKYDATLTNPKPPGEIRSQGTFGPWAAEEPGDTPLAGDYTFQKADLGVFAGIAGILNSTGHFEGNLSSIHARGEAAVPDFRLKRSGNPVPLLTRFEVLIDGTNGDTILKPVIAMLGTTSFSTSGGVIKHESNQRRMIKLDVFMPKGNLRDLLRLAMKGMPLMKGQISLKTTIEIPPLSGKVKEKLLLDGRFEVSKGKFLRSTMQDQIDTLSRRGQGQPTNQGIDQVILLMGGAFKLEDEVITFPALSFSVPGAAVDLAGNYDISGDALDFHGTLKLQAKISQTMMGWKRWILKPVDPFFAKQGAGTFLRIKIDGTASQPKFGLDRGRKDRERVAAANSEKTAR
jgi:hypothetical protein